MSGADKPWRGGRMREAMFDLCVARLSSGQSAPDDGELEARGFGADLVRDFADLARRTAEQTVADEKRNAEVAAQALGTEVED